MLSLLLVLAGLLGILLFTGTVSLYSFLIAAIVAGLIFCAGAWRSVNRGRSWRSAETQRRR